MEDCPPSSHSHDFHCTGTPLTTGSYLVVPEDPDSRDGSVPSLLVGQLLAGYLINGVKYWHVYDHAHFFAVAPPQEIRNTVFLILSFSPSRKMDYIKSSLGYGSQSGQEPISGEVGKGTADQPYDAGNVAGQSGAPAAEATSTHPSGTSQYDTGVVQKDSGTTQFDTGETAYTNATDSDTRGDNKMNTSETLAAGVTSGDSLGDAPADGQPQASTSAAAGKGTDEGRRPVELITSTQTGLGSDANTNAQETFFQKADLSKDKPASSPKVPDEFTNKDPFSSSSGADTSSETAANTAANTQPAAPTSSATATTSNPSQQTSGSLAPEKGYRTADTEPHPQSSEVLSSATPGAALPSPHDQSSTTSFTQPADSSSVQQRETSPSTTQDKPSTAATAQGTRDTGDGDPGLSSAPSTSAAETEFVSPKTQPSEAEGGLAGVSHNTGSAPSAPATGSDALDDPALGASQGQGKKKMSEKIKEKLHIGRKSGD
ncbi:MAG: hypothetical protein Q9210_006682 [Variospora velana]